LLGAALIRRFIASENLIFESARKFLAFLSIIPVMCLVSATIGSTSLFIGGFILMDDVAELWLTWWLGDGIGVLIVTPLLLAWLGPKNTTLNKANTLNLMLAYTLLIITVYVGFGVPFGGGSDPLPLEFLVWPALLLLAMIFNAQVVTVGILIVASVAAWQTAHGLGPFHLSSTNHSLLMLQLFVGVTASTMMIVLGLVTETKKSHQLELENKKLKLSSRVFSDTHEGITITDADRLIVDVNPAFSNITGYSREEAIGQTRAFSALVNKAPIFIRKCGNKLMNMTIGKVKFGIVEKVVRSMLSYSPFLH